jgi:hypothetical protein
MIACVFATLIGGLRIMLRSNAKAAAKQGYLGEDGLDAGILGHGPIPTVRIRSSRLCRISLPD